MAVPLNANSSIVQVHMMYMDVYRVFSWFLQCMGFPLCEGCMYFQGRSPRKYIQHEGGTIPCTVKNMRQLTCTDRLYKAISFSARMSMLQYVCTVCYLYSVKYRTL